MQDLKARQVYMYVMCANIYIIQYIYNIYNIIYIYNILYTYYILYYIYTIYLCTNTNSAAQGGSGSFKDRTL